MDESAFESILGLLLDSNDLSNSLEDWAKGNCSVFDQSEEHKLEYTTLYKEFQSLFETKFESMLRSQGISTEQFYASASQALERDTAGSAKDVLHMLLALTEYETFVDMMRYQSEAAR